MTDNYIVLDTETTGLNPARDKVLEIGAARIEQGRVVETFETLIDTGVPIPERITELTGITDAMQAEGKKTEEAFREFFDFCKDLPILGHNITFDFSFLKQMAVNLGYSFEKDGIDTLKIARKVLADLPPADCRICVSITGLIRGIPTEPLMMHWQHMNCCRGCGRNSERKNRMHLLQDRCSTVQKSRVRLRIHKKDT